MLFGKKKEKQYPCPHCGKDVLDPHNSRFCNNCGKNLYNVQQPEQQIVQEVKPEVKLEVEEEVKPKIQIEWKECLLCRGNGYYAIPIQQKK